MTHGPISRPLIVATVPNEGVTAEVVANHSEREAIAALNDVIAIDSFDARLEVTPSGREGFAVRGRLKAMATRTCVVSLEPFAETIDEPIELRFVPEGDPRASAESDDPPDEIHNGVIDLGAVAAEFFTLALDPYPKKPGAAFSAAEDEDDPTDSPFAALNRLKPDGHKPN